MKSQTNIFDAIRDNNLTEFNRIIRQTGFNINQRDSDNDTPLTAASQYSRYTIMNILLDNGADADAFNRYRQTALWWISSFSVSADGTAVLNRMLDTSPKSFDLPTNNAVYFLR